MKLPLHSVIDPAVRRFRLLPALLARLEERGELPPAEQMLADADPFFFERLDRLGSLLSTGDHRRVTQEVIQLSRLSYEEVLWAQAVRRLWPTSQGGECRLASLLSPLPDMMQDGFEERVFFRIDGTDKRYSLKELSSDRAGRYYLALDQRDQPFAHHIDNTFVLRKIFGSPIFQQLLRRLCPAPDDVESTTVVINPQWEGAEKRCHQVVIERQHRSPVRIALKIITMKRAHPGPALSKRSQQIRELSGSSLLPQHFGSAHLEISPDNPSLHYYCFFDEWIDGVSLDSLIEDDTVPEGLVRDMLRGYVDGVNEKNSFVIVDPFSNNVMVRQHRDRVSFRFFDYGLGHYTPYQIVFYAYNNYVYRYPLVSPEDFLKIFVQSKFFRTHLYGGPRIEMGMMVGGHFTTDVEDHMHRHLGPLLYP